MELRGSTGIRGNNSNNKKYEKFKHIIGQRVESIANGMTEDEISNWVDELIGANRNVACADPDLAAMEIEQVQKRSARYMVSSLGNLSTEKPDGYKWIMYTQLNGISTDMRHKTKVEQSTILINAYNINVQAFVEP